MYRLRIAGAIPDGWENRLGGLRVVQEEGSEPPATTTLMGAVEDQAALLGVLNTLHELHLPLLLVEGIDLESIPAQPDTGGNETCKNEIDDNSEIDARDGVRDHLDGGAAPDENDDRIQASKHREKKEM